MYFFGFPGVSPGFFPGFLSVFLEFLTMTAIQTERHVFRASVHEETKMRPKRRGRKIKNHFGQIGKVAQMLILSNNLKFTWALGALSTNFLFFRIILERVGSAEINGWSGRPKTTTRIQGRSQNNTRKRGAWKNDDGRKTREDRQKSVDGIFRGGCCPRNIRSPPPPRYPLRNTVCDIRINSQKNAKKSRARQKSVGWSTSQKLSTKNSDTHELRYAWPMMWNRLLGPKKARKRESNYTWELL